MTKVLQFLFHLNNSKLLKEYKYICVNYLYLSVVSRVNKLVNMSVR
jgi:hypothetical protein